MLKYLGNERGLTLSEMLVAITILGVAVIGLMGMFSTAQMNYIGAGKETKALNLAQQKVEEVRSKKWATIANEPLTNFPSPNNQYKYKVDVETPGVDIKKVTVTVTFKFGQSEKEVKLITMVSARWQL